MVLVLHLRDLGCTISGWAPQSNPNASIIAVNNWAPAQATPLSPLPTALREIFCMPNLPNNVVEVYDANFNLVNTFTDPTLGPTYGHSASRISTDWSM